MAGLAKLGVRSYPKSLQPSVKLEGKLFGIERYFFIPAALAASFHLAVSVTMKRANTSGPPLS